MKTLIVALTLILGANIASAQHQFNYVFIETLQDGDVIHKKDGETKAEIRHTYNSGVYKYEFFFNDKKFEASVEDIIILDDRTLILMDKGVVLELYIDSNMAVISYPRSDSKIIKITLFLI